MIGTRNQTIVFLVLILVAALGLRLWGIWFGLPFIYHADEYHEVFRALELGSGGFNFERTGKGGYFYVLFVEYGVLFVALKIAGIVDSAQEFAKYFARDPSSFYLIGRATTAVIGALNVFLVYRLGSRAYSISAGLLAAAFLSVDFLSAEHSHFITVDIPMTCLATAALLFAVKMATDGGARDYRWAAFFAALATTTKVPAILLLLPLLIAHYYYVRRNRGGARQFFLSPDLWWAVAIFIVVLAITNPGYFINPPIASMFIGAGEADTESAELIPSHVVSHGPPNLYIFYVRALGDSMGWPLLLASLTGVVFALWRRTPADVMLVSFAVIFYLVFSSSSDPYLYYPRYMLPVIVVLALMAGRMVDAAWPRGGVTSQAVAVGVVVVLAFSPTYRTIANDHLISQTDTRTVAKEWFDNNVPEGAKVFIEGGKIGPVRETVPLQDTADNIRGYIDYYRTREPGKSKYLEFELQVMSGSRYDLELVSPQEFRDLDYYKQEGIQYLVIRPQSFATSRKLGDRGAAFLSDLRSDPALILLKTFRPDPVSRPGPVIEIFQIEGRTAGLGNTINRNGHLSPVK